MYHTYYFYYIKLRLCIISIYGVSYTPTNPVLRRRKKGLLTAILLTQDNV